MKRFLTILLLTLSTAAQAQTIRTLGFNTTNGQVVANTGTNVLTFTNTLGLLAPIQFSGTNAAANAAISRTNLGFTYGTSIVIGSLDAETNSISSTLFIGDGADLYFDGIGSDGADQWREALLIPLSALTNTSNVTMMRALSGSTNTNHPYSGSISVTGTNNTNTLVFSNGILQSVQ